MAFYNKLCFLHFILCFVRKSDTNHIKLRFMDEKRASLIENSFTSPVPLEFILADKIDGSVLVGAGNKIFSLKQDLRLEWEKEIPLPTEVSYFADTFLCVTERHFVICDRAHKKSCCLYERGNLDNTSETCHASKNSYHKQIYRIQAKVGKETGKCNATVPSKEFVDFISYKLDYCKGSINKIVNVSENAYNEISFFHDNFLKNITYKELLKFEFRGAAYYLWTVNEETRLTRLENSGTGHFDRKVCCNHGGINYTLAVAAAVSQLGNGRESEVNVSVVFRKSLSEAGSVVCTFQMRSSTAGSKKTPSNHDEYWQKFCSEREASTDVPIFAAYQCSLRRVATSLVLKTVGNSVNAYVGTADGFIEVLTTSKTSWKYVYELPLTKEAELQPSNQFYVRRSYDFDKEYRHIYMLTENKVIKLSLNHCPLYSNHSTCVQEGLRFGCGWCEGWCTTKYNCSGQFHTSWEPEVKKVPLINCSLFLNCDTCAEQSSAFKCVWCGTRCTTRSRCKRSTFDTFCTLETKPNEELSRNDLTLELSIGLTVGVVLILLSVLIGYLFYKRKSGGYDFRRFIRRLPDKDQRTDGYRLQDIEKPMDTENLNVDKNDIKLEGEIGQSRFGIVYKGRLLKRNDLRLAEVAVKTLHITEFNWMSRLGVQGNHGTTVGLMRSQKAGMCLDNETADTFYQLGLEMKEFRHINVLEVIGFCFEESGQPMIIQPLPERGDLKTYIQDKRNDDSCTVVNLIDFGWQVAQGMEFLATKKFIHKDLAARNCLLNENFTVKVADFSLSKDNYRSDYHRSEKNTYLPLKWMAPESLSQERFSTSSDVWSYGVLLWELFTRGMSPYNGLKNVNDLLDLLQKEVRLEAPVNCPDEVFNVMQRCWEYNPAKRPNFSDLVKDVGDVYTLIKEKRDGTRACDAGGLNEELKPMMQKNRTDLRTLASFP